VFTKEVADGQEECRGAVGGNAGAGRGEERLRYLDYGLVGDTRTTLRPLLPRLTQHKDDGHLKAALEHYRDARKGLDELATAESGGEVIHPQYVARVVDELAAEDAVFTCGVGTPTIWAAL
jgi:pyruvate dehydrogenase (quinone)